ncbi:MAG: DNA-binding NarL/FixJ family response regulator [Acidimicrobiales bacterium]
MAVSRQPIAISRTSPEDEQPPKIGKCHRQGLTCATTVHSLTTSQHVSRVSLVDDHRLFAEALTLALELSSDLRVTSNSIDAPTGFDAIVQTQPDVAVVDYRLKGSDTGVDLARRIRAAEGRESAWLARLPIVLLTGFPTPGVLRTAATLDGVSVLSKDSPIVDIVAALRAVLVGTALTAMPEQNSFGLTRGELEVLEFLSTGLNASEISRTLCVTIHAVRARIKTTLKKLDVNSQLEAVAIATRRGIVVPPQSDQRSKGVGQLHHTSQLIPDHSAV